MKLDIRYYLSIFFRRIHYFALIAILVTAAGTSVAVMLPPVFVSRAVLLVEGAQIPSDLAASTVRTGPEEQAQVIKQLLTTRNTLLEIADDLKIYPNREGVSPDAIVSDMRERVIINPSFGRGGSNTMTVAFSGSDPRKAAEVTNDLVSRILEQSVEMRAGRATQTSRFFQDEVERLAAEMDRKSKEILEFKLANQDALPESLTYLRSQQASLQERSLQLQRDRAALVERQASLQDLFDRTGRVTPVSENLTPEQRQLQTLQSELDNALLVYSPTNPRVKVLQAKIAALESSVAASQGATPQDDGPSLFEVQMSDIETQIGQIDADTARIAEEVEQIQETIASTPSNSIALDELTRAYSATQSQYNAAIQRLAEARTGERIETLSQGQRITLLEEARVPTQPEKPNRPLIASASLGAGLGLGLAVVVLLELLNSSIRRPVEIVNKLGITPLGTLPYVRTRRERLMRRGLIGGALAFALVGIPAGIWALDTYYLPIDLLVDRLLDRSGITDFLVKLSGGPGA